MLKTLQKSQKSKDSLIRLIEYKENVNRMFRSGKDKTQWLVTKQKLNLEDGNKKKHYFLKKCQNQQDKWD